MQRTPIAWLASSISHLLCPSLLAMSGSILVTVAQPAQHGWCYTGLYIALAVALPVSIFFWLHLHGKVSDLDISLRSERTKPFLAALSGAAIAWGCLVILQAPGLLQQFAIAHCATVCVAMLITLHWKISLHCAGAAGVAAILATVVGVRGMWAITPVVMVAWSRIYLGRHTIPQTLAGTLLGALVFMFFFTRH